MKVSSWVTNLPYISLLFIPQLIQWASAKIKICFNRIFCFLNLIFLLEAQLVGGSQSCDLGYRAVVCGMDPVCCESSSWMETAHVEKLTRGPDQPFYQVLVDVNADPNLLVAYVPEENLLALDQPDTDRFDHPYVSFLFYGADAAGDFIPIKQLRDKFSRPRHEVPYDEDGDDKSGEGA